MDSNTPTLLNCDQVSADQLKKLSDNFYRQFLKFDENNHLKKLSRTTDSGAVWISKADLDALFHSCSSGNEETGLTIYFIVHDKNMDLPLPDYDDYHNQLSVVFQTHCPGLTQARITSRSICPPGTNCRS